MRGASRLLNEYPTPACFLLCVSLRSSCHSYLVRDNVTGMWSDTNPFNPDYEHEGQPVPNPQSECIEVDEQGR